VPDRDWYSAHVPKNWRGAARRIAHGADFDRTGDLALSAFTRTIKEAGGIAGFDEMLSVVERFAAGLTNDAARELRNALHTIQRTGDWELTQIAYAAAQGTLASIARGDCGPAPAHEFARRCVVQTLDAKLFAPSRLRTVGPLFATFESAHDWQRRCVDAMAERIDKVGAGFLQHRSGVGLRAPPRASPRLKTADLLYQEIK